MKMRQVALYGALGGCCPTIAKLGSYYSANTGAPLPEPSIIFALSIFAVLGAIVAIAVDSTNVKAAIVAGIAAPGIVMSIVSQQPDYDPSMLSPTAVPTESEDSSFELFGIKTSLAQDFVSEPNISLSPSTEHTISVRSDLVRSSGNIFWHALPSKLVGVTAIVDRNDRKTRVPLGAFDLFRESLEYEVPKGTNSIEVAGREFDLDGLTEVIVKFAATSSLKSDFLWIFGMRRQFDAKVLQVIPIYDDRRNSGG